MAITVTEVVEAFAILFDSIHDRDFRKTLPLHEYGERELLPLIRTYLLGYFSQVSPEKKTALPGNITGEGLIDFVVGNVAIEFAVRRPMSSKANLSSVTNSTEIKKLMKWDGLGLLVLFDFSKSPFDREDLERYRDWPSLGRGNHKKSPFNVAYFYRPTDGQGQTANIRLNIRV